MVVALLEDLRRSLLARVNLLDNYHPQVLLLRATLNPFSTQPVFVLGITQP